MRFVRDQVLQRCIAVILHGLKTTSQHGVDWDLPGIGSVRAVPRVVLYAADQPEERRILGFNLSGCRFPCSHCNLTF